MAAVRASVAASELYFLRARRSGRASSKARASWRDASFARASVEREGNPRDPEELARTHQAEEARNRSGRALAQDRDGRRRAARARLRPDARQFPAPRASVLAAG